LPAKLDRCIRRVKGKKGVKNAYAICVAATGIKKKKGGGWSKGKKKKKRKRKKR